MYVLKAADLDRNEIFFCIPVVSEEIIKLVIH